MTTQYTLRPRSVTDGLARPFVPTVYTKIVQPTVSDTQRKLFLFLGCPILFLIAGVGGVSITLENWAHKDHASIVAGILFGAVLGILLAVINRRFVHNYESRGNPQSATAASFQQGIAIVGAGILTPVFATLFEASIFLLMTALVVLNALNFCVFWMAYARRGKFYRFAQ